MSSITTTWLSGGTLHSHTSTSGVGETFRELSDRHDEEVAALMATYPPDPPA